VADAEFLSEDHDLKPEEMKSDGDDIDADYGDEQIKEPEAGEDEEPDYGDEVPSDQLSDHLDDMEQ